MRIGPFRSIDFHFDSAGGGDQDFAVALFTERDAGLCRDHSRDTCVVTTVMK
jgi:hypothetical protein